MAARRPAGAGAVLAQEHKGDAGNGGKIVRRPRAADAPPQPAGNRRALGDVSNLINARAAAAQAVANRQKTVAVAAKKCVKAIKPLKENTRVKPEVIVISPDSEDEKKRQGLTAAVTRIPTLTSFLTKCSKASDGMVSISKKAPRYDIDSSDAHNELAVVDYVEDIYMFYKRTEGSCRPLCTYMSIQTEINERMRAILTDWLIEVHHKFMLMPETLFLTVHIIDRYLSLESVPRKELQLVGVCAMLIASKYEEIWAPLVKDFVCISDNSFSREQVLGKEKAILNKLQWNLTVPTMYMFLVRYLKAAMGDKELENMTFFYAELALVQYSMLIFSPSVTAAAAVYAARCTLDMSPLWSDVLEYHTGLAEPQLLEGARRLISLHSTAPESRQKVVYKKYSHHKLGAVALHSPAKHLLPLR